MVIRQVGFRGASLLLLGGIAVAYGSLRMALGSSEAIDFIPSWAYLLWILSGLVAIPHAWRKTKDWVGFSVLVLPPAAWMSFYAASTVLWLVTRGEYGALHGIVRALVFSGWVALIVLTSRWPEPVHPVKRMIQTGE